MASAPGSDAGRSTALFVTVVALIAFGVGSIIRHTAGAITSAIGLMFVIPIIVQLRPLSVRHSESRSRT